MNPATSLLIYSPCWCKREAITKKLQGLHKRDTLLPHPMKWFGLFKVRKNNYPPKGNEFGNQRGKQVFSIIFKSVQACWTDAAIQYMYMHIFFARSISLWTGSLNKDEVTKITAVPVIFFVFVGQTEARAGQVFHSSSLANDLHFALASIPLRETHKKKFCLFCKLKNEENTKAGSKKKGGDRGGKEDRERGGEIICHCSSLSLLPCQPLH